MIIKTQYIQPCGIQLKLYRDILTYDDYVQKQERLKSNDINIYLRKLEK